MKAPEGDVRGILSLLAAHQQCGGETLDLAPRENLLSPLARLPLVLGAYAGNVFRPERTFGDWKIPGGVIEQDMFVPALRRLTRAPHVDVQALGGEHGSAMVLRRLTKPGDRVLSVPESMGGAPAMSIEAARLGLEVTPLAMFDLEAQLRTLQPAIIYLDQASVLFPLDPQPLRALIDRVSPQTVLHYDSSHLNGLILAGIVPNPLEHGAHSLGGRTHETLAGVHKGFFATADAALFARFEAGGGPFVTHTQVAEAVALTIALQELEHCSGARYAKNTVANARAFGEALHARGVEVAGADRGFTDVHQLWVVLPQPQCSAAALREVGLSVDCVPRLPGIERPALRLSFSALTQRGLLPGEVPSLAALFVDALDEGHDRRALRQRVRSFCAQHRRPSYGFTLDQVGAVLPERLHGVAAALYG